MSDLVQRAKDILLDPRGAWPRIADEPATVASIYNPYVLVLAAIGPVAGFIGLSLIGVGGFGTTFRVPLVRGLVQMVVGYGLSLAMVYAMALVVDWLAPNFGGQRNPIAALKLVAYSATAGMLGGFFSLLPSLSGLGLLAALYSMYLIFLGVPLLMRCPQEKALPYTGVVVVAGFVTGIVLAGVSSLFTGAPHP